MILGFHSKQLSERGTEVALFDYAVAARDLLGHEVRVYIPANARMIVPLVKRRFEEQLDVVLYDRPDQILCDALYSIKKGSPGRITATTPELNHAFDDVSRPHGHRFAAVSRWLAGTATQRVRVGRRRALQVRRLRPVDVVPHIVTLPDVDEDLRHDLRIPDEAVVFGWHGGNGNLDVGFVRDPIRTALTERDDIWFVFMNAEAFFEHTRVRYLPVSPDRADVRRFVNTCDYMVHAHLVGETFGLAVAEFAYVGAPVITFLDSPRRGHLELLSGELRLGYQSQEGLLTYLRGLGRRLTPVRSDVPSHYSPERVMERFRDVFLR
jgi:glycosyltransferase involved in cell wall biosynthesis